MNEDASWHGNGWMGQASSGPNNLRYYRKPPASRPLFSATRNRLLNCNPAPLSARETTTKLKEIKEKYRIMNLERQRNADREQHYVPYVTKVQINLKPLETRKLSAARLKPDKNTELQNGFERSETTCSRNDSDLGERNYRLEPLQSPTDRSVVGQEENSFDEPLSVQSMNRHDVNQLISRLHEQLTTSRSAVLSKGKNRPLASFARPTKGEIALMHKGMRPINQLKRGKAHTGLGSDLVALRSNSFSTIEALRNTERENQDLASQETTTELTRIKGIRGRPISKSAPHRLHTSSILDNDKCLCSNCKTDLKYEQKLSLLYGSQDKPRSTGSRSTELSGRSTDGSTWWSKDFEERRIQIRLNMEEIRNNSEIDFPPAAPPSPVLE